MAKRKRDDDDARDDPKESEEEEGSEAEGGEEAAIDNDLLEESLDDAPVDLTEEEELDAMGFHTVDDDEDMPEYDGD